MAFQGPTYGLSRECQLKASCRFNRLNAQAKFDIELAMQAINWLQSVTQIKIEPPFPEKGFQDQKDFGEALKDGIALCQLMNKLSPGVITKINTAKSPFKEVIIEASRNLADLRVEKQKLFSH
ncbi:calponin-1-like protein [Dinothrombium tinctorium]|uniref:Calponin-1-like protein n=1 Tax=Dinothrombium tinctorium TaxID=1965070 RepID=A0A3S3SDW7_9ACAR|nr:calponin-1-like protein [Dinothrombium tinctorium]RWS12826.1 calponin-1-like protein [Dinothrombium tinctorium]